MRHTAIALLALASCSAASPASLSIILPAYDYLQGVNGEMLNYHDSTPANLGSTTWRIDQGPDCNDYRCAWVDNGEWMQYTRTFGGGVYNIYLEATSLTATTKYTLTFMNPGTSTPVVGYAPITITFAPTNSWTIYQSQLVASSVTVPDGMFTLRFTTVASGANVRSLNFVPVTGAPTTAPTAIVTPVPTTAKPTMIVTPVPTTAKPITAVPTLASLADPTCLNGLASWDRTVCCPKTCVACGGPGCELRVGGYDACCALGVKAKAQSCALNAAPCMIGAVVTSAPVTVPPTPAPTAPLTAKPTALPTAMPTLATPVPTPKPTLATNQGDPTCINGFANSDRSACCPKTCGGCGGAGCQDFLGGFAACCAVGVKATNLPCATNSAPCVMAPAIATLPPITTTLLPVITAKPTTTVPPVVTAKPTTAKPVTGVTPIPTTAKPTLAQITQPPTQPFVMPANGRAYLGVKQTIPGFLAAYKFDEGGKGIAYKDVSPTNQPKLRAGETVGGTGIFATWTAASEWLRFTVTVAQTGIYGVNFALAGAPSSPGLIDLRIIVDSTDCTKPPAAKVTTLFRTGTWQTPLDYGGGDISLTAGDHYITMCFVKTASTNFFGIRFGAAGTGNIIPSANLGASANSVPTAVGYGNWPLRWNDEFKGTALNQTVWGISTGNRGGWGNKELENYQASGLRVEAGNLVVEASKQQIGNTKYVSGKTYSKGEKGYNFLYGRLETRINLGKSGQGLWPAFWALPNKFDSNGWYGGWPTSGEIDLLEVINDYEATYHTIHYGTMANHQHQSCQFYAGSTGSFELGWHVYAVEWAPWGEFKFYVDGTLACDMSTWWIPNKPFPAPFNQPFYVMANLAVGGAWPVWVDDKIFANNYKFQMLVDYVRVYNWPSSRRRLHEVPEGWHVPEGYNLVTGEWDSVPDFRKRNTAEASFLPVMNTPVVYLPAKPDAACVAEPYNRQRGTDFVPRPQPWLLPETTGSLSVIGAEFYDQGGQGCGFLEVGDVDANTGNCLLRGDSVDLTSYDNSYNGPYVSSMVTGEYLQYTVSSTTDAAYAVEVVGFSLQNSIFRIMMDTATCDPELEGVLPLMTDRGMAGGAPLDFRMFGSVVPIPFGVHTLKLCVVDGDMNVDFLRFTHVSDELNADGSSIDYSSEEVPPMCISHTCGTDMNVDAPTPAPTF